MKEREEIEETFWSSYTSPQETDFRSTSPFFLIFWSVGLNWASEIEESSRFALNTIVTLGPSQGQEKKPRRFKTYTKMDNG